MGRQLIGNSYTEVQDENTMKSLKNCLQVISIGLLITAPLASAHSDQGYYSASPIPVAVEPPQAIDDGWHYEIAPYLWMSGVSSDVTVQGVTQHVHLTFSDILKYLEFAAEGHIEAGYGPWSFMVDPTYLKISQDFTTHSIPVDTKQQTVLIDTGVFWRVFASPAVNYGSYSTFELLGGARYMGINTTLDADSLFSVSSNQNSLSPIVGGRFKFHVNPKAQFWLKGDVGGFHVDGMKSTWSVTGGFAYAVQRHIDIGIAYRVLKMNYAKDQVALNTLMYGPMLGFSLHN
jgi:hypothetical protein